MGLGALQPGHLIVILVIVLLIFGPGKLPDLGKAMGEGLKELKKATNAEEPAKDGGTTAATTTTTAAAAATAPAASSATGGAPVTAAARPCPSCQGSVPVGDKFCGNCGASMETAPARTA